MVSVFIDNLPKTMDETWLEQIFSSYGPVLDVIIPKKRSSKSNSKFGFVRFGHKYETLKAINDLHGEFIRECKLFVKLALFTKPYYSDHPKLQICAVSRKRIFLESIMLILLFLMQLRSLEIWNGLLFCLFWLEKVDSNG